MNMPSASYVAQPSHGSCDLVTDYHVSRNRGHDRCYRSPEILSTSERIAASDYSDAGDTLPSYSTADDSDTGWSSHHGHKDVVASRDFILKRFLPAAQAMTAIDRKSSAPTPSIPSQHRSASMPKYSGFGTRTRRSRPVSFESVSSRSKSRFIREVKQDVTGFSDDEDEERFSAVCGFPLHLGRLTALQFRCNSFWMSSRSGCRGNRARSTPHKVESVKAVVQDDSDNSDDLFWSDEPEVFEDAAKAPELHATPCPDMRKGSFTAPPARLHSLETVHTPDHRGFLGVPNRSHSGEMERARQVDRLGARLARLISKTNYMESSRNYNIRHADDVQCEGAGPGSSSATSAAAEKKSRRSGSGSGSKWVDAVASLRPPPSPKMPSESWLSSTLPPERFLMVKNLPRRPLRSFIPIEPPAKPPSEEENGNLLRQVRQTCSLKEHAHGRLIQSPSVQAV